MTVGYEVGGFPSFSVFTPVSGSYYEPDSLQGSYNNATIFHYSFQIQKTGNIMQMVDAIPCSEAIPRYMSDAYDLEQVLANYGRTIGNFLCPDIAQFDLLISNWLDF